MVQKIARRKFLAQTAAGAAALSMPYMSFAQNKTPIKVGVIISLSGPIVAYGQTQKIAAEIAADLINKSGGIDGRPLEIIIRDDKLTPTEAVSQVRDLLGQGVNLFIGGIFTPITLAISGLMPDARALFISTGAIGDSPTHEAFNRNYFRVTDSAIMRYTATAEAVAIRNPGVKRWGAVIPDLEGLGLSPWRAFSAAMKGFYPKYNKGVKPEFVDPVFFKLGAADYKAPIQQAMSLGLDGVFTSASPPTFWQQVKLLGLESKVKVIVDAGSGNTVARALKKDAPTVWNSDHWYHGLWTGKNKLAKEFVDEWIKRTGDTDPSGFAEPPYSALLALKKAITTAHTAEPEVLIRVMEGMTFDTVQGPQTFRKEDHQVLGPVDVYKIGPANNALGYAMTEAMAVDASKHVEPASPGKAIVYPQ